MSTLTRGARRLKRAEDLRKAASQDAVVRSHYSHFDFDHARLVRVAEAAKCMCPIAFATPFTGPRKKFASMSGVAVDRRTTTARAHCGNQISDVAKPTFPTKSPTRMFSTIHPGGGIAVRSDPPVIARRLADGQPVGPQLFAADSFFLCALWCAASCGRCPVNDTVANGHCQPITNRPSFRTFHLVVDFPRLAMIAWRYRRTTRPSQRKRKSSSVLYIVASQCSSVPHGEAFFLIDHDILRVNGLHFPAPTQVFLSVGCTSMIWRYLIEGPWIVLIAYWWPAR